MDPRTVYAFDRAIADAKGRCGLRPTAVER